MKKILSVLLSALMLFSMVAIGVSAEENSDLIITVANDLHYNHTAKAENVADGTYKEDYANVVSTGQLKLENELIIDEFLKQAAANGSTAILLPGDITDKGTDAELAYMAEKLTAFEAETGIEVYPVPGNHDYYNGCTVEEYKAFFAELVYDQAVAVDTKTASYVADIDDEYRVLAIDATKPRSVQNLNEELYAWIEAQLKAAKADGKKVIAISHYNLLEHLVLVEVLHPGSILSPELNLPELFAQYNVKYTFTGHTHDHDIASYTGSNGVTIYDIVSSTINAYPCPYRVVTFGEKVKIQTKFIESIDTAALQGKITDATYNLATESFPEYAENMLTIGTEKIIKEYLTPSKIKSMLKLDATEDAELGAIIDSILPVFVEAICMPVYAEDETEKGKSLEAIISQYGLTIPESEYEAFIDLAVDLYLAHILGDENHGILTKEFNILVSGFTGVLNYTLDRVTAQEYAQIMTVACNFLGADIPDGIFKLVGTGLEKAKGIEFFITSVVSPLILEFSTDESPADNNATLPGYEVEAEKEGELSLWDKIVSFFKNIIAYLLRIVGLF